jgi:hypothetical protein
MRRQRGQHGFRSAPLERADRVEGLESLDVIANGVAATWQVGHKSAKALGHPNATLGTQGTLRIMLSPPWRCRLHDNN